MAVRQDLLQKLDQNLVLQLKSIISSDISDFDKLDEDQKKTLFTAALSVGYKTNLELFLDLKNHPEKIGLPPLPPEKLETATVNAQLLAALVDDFENRETLDQKIDSIFKSRTERDRALIKLMVQMMIHREQARILSEKADQKSQKALDAIHSESDPKSLLYPTVRQDIEEIIEASVTQTEIAYTKPQIDEAIGTLAVATMAGLVDFTDPASTSTAIQVALASNPEYQTDVTAITHQIEDHLTLTPFSDYESTTTTQVTPNVSISLSKISLSVAEINLESAGIVLPPPLQDRAEQAQKAANNLSEKIITNSKTQLILSNLTNTITPQQEKELTAILIIENLVARSQPTQNGAAAATAISVLDPDNPFIDAPTIRIASMGLDLKKLDQHLIQKPDSKLASFVHENPQVLTKLKTGFYHLGKPENDLSKEISQRLRIPATQTGTLPPLPSKPAPSLPPPPRIPPPLPPLPSKSSPFSGITAKYQTITNKISGLLPGRAGQIFNVITHPIQFIQSKIGNFIGKQIAGKFKTFLIEKVGAKIANESFKRAAQFVLEKGLQKGLEKVASFAIAKIGGTALIAGISAALGVSTGGVSLVIQAAIMAAMWVGEKVLGIAKNMVNGLSQAMTGEDFDWKPVAAAPLLLLGGAGGILASLGAATSVAAMSAGVALIISTVLGFFFYIIVITVAPIISTIAHLDSGLGPQQGPAFNITSPPYTGPVLPGCSKLWPVAGGLVIQGPHGAYSHQTIEAVDILVPIGTQVKSISSGVVAKTGWGDAYGNWIWITSTSQDGKTYSAIYGHLSEIGVAVGSNVGVGTLIALSGATSSVPGFANPHLHIEYRGIAYNACPGGGVQIPDGCYSAIIGQTNACLINGKPIYTN